MVDNDMKVFLHDTRGVSVVFGTLLLILITIIAASGVAYMVSNIQQDAMERESQRELVENEELKIVSINPSGNGSNWESIDLQILNLNIADSYISSIRINDNFFLHYKAYDDSNTFDTYNGYTAVYGANHRVKVPAAKSKILHLNFSNITVTGSERIYTNSWVNNSLDFTCELTHHPWEAFSEVPYDYSVTFYDNGTKCLEAGNFSIDNESMEITFFGDNSGGNLTNTEDYNIYYEVDFPSFMGPKLSYNDPLKVEIITSYINVFKELFTPPMPLADVQFRVEYLPSGNGSITDEYLILDASDSIDSDGFITGYKWTVWQGSDQYNLSGMVVRYDETSLSNLTIDLKLTDDDGMTSRLSEVSGNITIL